MKHVACRPALVRVTFGIFTGTASEVTHAMDSDTNAERDDLIEELKSKRYIDAVKVYQTGQRLPTEHINHYH